MEPKLTFHKAVELAQSIESAEKDAEELQPTAPINTWNLALKDPMATAHSGLTKDVIDVGRVIGRLNAFLEFTMQILDIWKGYAEARLGGLNH
jgi:hypothetical protein